MTTDDLRALEPNARRRLQRFADCFERPPVFDYFVDYSLGLLAQLDRKSIEPIARWIGAAVRTLQRFLSQFAWAHARIESRLRRSIMDEYGDEKAIGVIDGSANAKQGNKTRGVQRQWCGESGKIDNCVVGQHLIHMNNECPTIAENAEPKRNARVLRIRRDVIPESSFWPGNPILRRSSRDYLLG